MLRAARLLLFALAAGAAVYAQTPLQPLALPNGRVGVEYSSPLVTGGAPPYYCYLSGEFEQSPLPPGLVLEEEGSDLVGTPTASGTYQFSAYCFDNEFTGFAAGDSPLAFIEHDYTITIDPMEIAAVPAPPGGAVGVPYSHTFSALGGVSPYTWSVVQGVLPSGLTLNSSGVLSGIPTGAASYTFVVQLEDAQERSAQRTFSITVVPLLLITTSTLPGGMENVPYAAQLQASGAVAPYSWSVAAGALPPGLALAATGRISGTPTAYGSWQFTARAMSSTGQTATRIFTIQIEPYAAPLEITTTSLHNATVQAPYAAVLGATGGQPPYTWSATGLPPGLSLAGAAISGTPTSVGLFGVSVTVTDQAGRSAGVQLPLNVIAPSLNITTASPLPAATVGTPFSLPFGATGGSPPYSWGVVVGALPSGTSFSTGGILSGAPFYGGDYTFTVQVRDSRGTVANRAFSIRVEAPVRITTTSLPPGRVGQPYSTSLGASGGEPPYSWTISNGAAGLSGDAAGNIAGTPAAAGSFTVAAEVTDSRGASASASLGLVILPALLSITTASLPDGAVGAPYAASFSASGGAPPYRWAAVAGYAGGLELSSAGALSGTPGATGDYTVYVQVTDSEGATAMRGFPFRIGLPALAIVTASLPDGVAGSPYSAALSASGASGAVNWSAGGLPDGLSIDSGSGAISGAPLAPGASNVIVRVTDAAGRTAERTLALTVGLPPPPGVNFVAPSTTNPAMQPPIQLGLDGVYPVPIGGRVVLTFQADGGGDDPAVQFSNGARSVDFTIPAGANLATFTVPALAMQTGTVAGTITLTASLQAAGADITPSPTPSRTIRVNRMAPVITRLTVARNASGFEINVTGYSTTREVTQAIFRLAQAPGGSLQTTELTVNVGPMFSAWYASPASWGFGSQFTFTQTFNIQGEASAIASVTAILVNSVGQSGAVSANLP